MVALSFNQWIANASEKAPKKTEGVGGADGAIGPGADGPANTLLPYVAAAGKEIEQRVTGIDEEYSRRAGNEPLQVGSALYRHLQGEEQ